IGLILNLVCVVKTLFQNQKGKSHFKTTETHLSKLNNENKRTKKPPPKWMAVEFKVNGVAN
ncbi:MAG: hypothetical protein AAGA30_18995, partial [Planctomycetota bacterium]